MSTLREREGQPFQPDAGNDVDRELVLEMLRTGVSHLVAGVKLKSVTAEQADDSLAGYVSRMADPTATAADLETVVDVKMAEFKARLYNDEEDVTQATPLQHWEDAADDVLTESARLDRTGVPSVEILGCWSTMAAVLIVEELLTRQDAPGNTADSLSRLMARDVDRVTPLLAPLRDAVVASMGSLLDDFPDPHAFAQVPISDLYNRATAVADTWKSAAVSAEASIGHVRASALAVTVRLLAVLLSWWPMREGPLGAQVTAQALLVNHG